MNNQQRAVQLWSVLALAAHNQQLLSYAMVEGLIGVPQYGLAPILGAVYAHCERKKFPPLSSIVVSEVTGLPRDAYPRDESSLGLDIIKDHSRVFVFDWLRAKAPSEEDFKEV